MRWEKPQAGWEGWPFMNSMTLFWVIRRLSRDSRVSTTFSAGKAETSFPFTSKALRVGRSPRNVALTKTEGTG